MRPYAADTEVTVEKSKMQIEKLLIEFKASSVMTGTNSTQSIIAFEMAERRVKFVLPLPQADQFPRHKYRNPQGALEQATRTRWRALYLALRAKLEMAATGITTFEDEFLAHIIMPDGQTVGEMTRPRIAQAYQSGEVRPLLEGPRT
jgi:hypothetical protein